MTRIMRKVGIMAGIALAASGLYSGPVHAQAVTVDCSLISPGVEGVVVFTPSGNLLGNCHEHIFDHTGGPAEGEAITVDCAEALGQEGPGVAVITPSGHLLNNCHIHVN